MFRQWLHTTLSETYPGATFSVLVPPDPKMGDYSTNIALIAKKNPQEICDALTAQGGNMIERCQVAGPGFINIFLKESYLQEQIGMLDIPQGGAGQKVIVEYSSPNIAKPMHVGHLRSTIIGDALANIYDALGYDVIRWNYLGDWGTQFGKLIAGYKRWPQEIQHVDDMAELYVRATAELDEDAGRAEFKKLEEGDAENRKIWEEFRAVSLREFSAMYQRLGVAHEDQMIVKGESAYEKDVPNVIADLEKRGLAKESEGALIVDLGDLPPGMVRKSDGATTYLARDVASLEDRVTSYHPAKILYVIANQQALHLEQLFAVKEKLGLDTPTVHVKYGLVLGEDGKKFSTREGNVIPLRQVMDEIVRRAAERNPETAEAIGIGALKYNDLRQHPHSDIVFNWDQMLDLGGNSGPYLQYTYARLAGIVAKAGTVGVGDRSLLIDPAERALMRQMLDFGYAIAECASLSALNGLALYLYELATLANRYYETVHINDDEDAARKAARIELITAVMAQLKKGLELLGIQALERI